MMTEIEGYRRSVAELQMQLQFAYKRIVELNKIIDNLQSTYNTPDKAEFAKITTDTCKVPPGLGEFFGSAALEPICNSQEYSRHLLNTNKDKLK